MAECKESEKERERERQEKKARAGMNLHTRDDSYWYSSMGWSCVITTVPINPAINKINLSLSTVSSVFLKHQKREKKAKHSFFSTRIDVLGSYFFEVWRAQKNYNRIDESHKNKIVQHELGIRLNT